MRYQPVNAWGIPTGRVEQRPAASELLGDKFIDDGYDEVAPGSVFTLSGGDRSIAVHFDHGFTAAQVFAPGDDDVVCFEPMAAPTDALRRGGYHVVQPGESVTAQFRIKVS
jgi:galactose mutarotase-like enzyme